MYNLVVMTSNVGSLFPYDEVLVKTWITNLFQLITKANSDMFVLHLQEFGYKHGLDRAECDKLIQDLRKEMLLQFDNMIIFSDLNSDDCSVYTALCSIYFWKSFINIEFYDFNNRIYKKYCPENFPKYHYESDEPNTPAKRIKFHIDLFPYKKYSRKGFLAVKVKITTTTNPIEINELTFVNLHLIHDMSFHPNDSDTFKLYSSYREKQLSYVLEWLYSVNSLDSILAGDFNFRTDCCTLAKELLQDDITHSNDIENESIKIMTKNSNEVVFMCHPKFFHINPNYLPTLSNIKSYVKADVELHNINFKFPYFEYPVKFFPSYCYTKDIENISAYSSKRCPSWCDRIILFGTNLIQNVKTNNSTHSTIYDTIPTDYFLGDHKPLYLILRF